MSTWEQRMAQRAAERERVRSEAARRQAEAEHEAMLARHREEQRGEFEAGPPDGCGQCWRWAPVFYSDYRYDWHHVTCMEEPYLCDHDCHGEPYWCGPIAFAGSFAATVEAS